MSGVTPDALYSNLLTDLSNYVDGSLLDLYRVRKDFPVDASPKEVAAISIARSLLKKWEYDSNDKRDSVALLKFLEVNKDCKGWELQLNNSHEEELFGSLKQAVWDFFNVGGHPLVGHVNDLLSRGCSGPGSSVDGRGGDFYTKFFDSPLSCTKQSLVDNYERYVRNFPEWAGGDKHRKLIRGNRIVEGNRLAFVPKNDETSRTICIEPTLNMFYQLGLNELILQRLNHRFGINLPIQQAKNRELARQGSVTGGYATIDLESASDSMSLRMLENILPGEFFAWLKLLRSERTMIPGLGYTVTDMVSTMGNGFTFSLQTALFSCVVSAVFRVREEKPLFPRGRCWGNFGVNGDDIIIPTALAGDVIRLLEILGFKTNRAKTFVEGPFRESCGGDFFKGYPVRGVYVKTLRSPQDRYSVINQLNLFSTRTGLLLPHTVKYLRESVRWLPVPRWESSDSGIQVPFVLAKNSLRICEETQSFLYYAWEPNGKKIRISERALVVPRGLKPRAYNPGGLFVSLLQGGINSFAIGVRQDTVVYRRRRRTAPNWDGSICSAFLARDELCYEPPINHRRIMDERWNTAAYLNLTSL